MRFRKKPIEIEAVQLTEENIHEPNDFITVRTEKTLGFLTCDPILGIKTLEGTMYAGVGDWIIKGVKGEFYPCRKDIFEETYEAVPE